MKTTHNLIQICLLGAILLASAAAANSQVTFVLSTNYAVSGPPVFVAAADVNGDGKVDLISGSQSGLAVFTNGGGGIFSSNAFYSAGGSQMIAVASDVNDDGKVDLISVNYTGGILTVLTNDGSGKFVYASSPHAGNVSRWVAVADINGDGLMDLIVSSGSSTSPLILLTNAGNGIFIAGPTLPSLPISGYSSFAVAADVNGDGKIDLVDLDSYGGAGFTLRILTNNGDGTFTLSSTNRVETALPGSLTAIDINGKGTEDLAVSDYSSGGGSTLEVFTNNGGGIFSSNATYTIGRGPHAVVAADVNGDGKLDLISASFTGSPTVLTNNGTGGFGPAASLSAVSSSVGVAAADVNGDGKLDLIFAGNSSLKLYVLTNATSFPTPASSPTLNINPSGNKMIVSWPSASPGWSLQQNPNLTSTNWSPSGYVGYGISDDGTNKSLIVRPPTGNLFFRLLHP